MANWVAMSVPATAGGPNWVTISSLATAAGTLVLAIATFSSVKSANRSARVAERSLLSGLRPVLIPTRDSDPEQKVRFGDGHWFVVEPHRGNIDLPGNGNLYLGFGVRNGGSGLAVIHGWRPVAGEGAFRNAPPAEGFRRQQRDLYVPAGEIGYWQGAVRDASDPAYRLVCDQIESGGRFGIDVLYGDAEGGQRTVARFSLSTAISDEGADFDPRPGQGRDGRYVFRAEVVRYFSMDGADPR